MIELTLSDKILLSNLTKDGLLDRLLTTIQHNIALEILDDSSPVGREDKYQLTKALKELKCKLQECVNDTISQESE